MPEDYDFFSKKYLYVIIIGVLTMGFIYQKEIKELKILSVILFFCIAVMIIVVIIELILHGTEKNPEKYDLTELWTLRPISREFATALAIILNAFMFQLTLF